MDKPVKISICPLGFLKFKIDTIPTLTVLETGSSSFDLLNKAGEPLTGRKIQFNLFPFSQFEWMSIETYLASVKHQL